MNQKKVLSALCYFSVFLFPLLIPFVIYLTADENDLKTHAKRAFISHLFPTVILIIGIIGFSISMFNVERRLESLIQQQFDFWSFAPFLFTLVYSLVFFIILIWNVLQGIKVLKQSIQ